VRTEGKIQTWLKGAKEDLYYLSVHVEEHAQKALAARLGNRAETATYEEGIVEVYYRRISELRSVIATQEGKPTPAV
jgi:hypothetical protein